MRLTLSTRRCFFAIVFLLLGPLPANGATPHPQQKPKALRIVVIEGEGAVNVIQQKTAVAPLVEVRDENDLPIAGVPVTFTVTSKTATLSGGQAVTVTTNAAGRAAVSSVTPLQTGTVQVQVSATVHGQTATVTITQTNVASAAQATELGARAATPGRGSQSSGGGSSGLTIAVIGAGAAAGGLAILKLTQQGTADEVLRCGFREWSSSDQVPAAGGTVAGFFRGSGCPALWSVSTDQPWLAIIGPSSFLDSATITVSASENTGPPREGNVIVTYTGDPRSIEPYQDYRLRIMQQGR